MHDWPQADEAASVARTYSQFRNTAMRSSFITALIATAMLAACSPAKDDEENLSGLDSAILDGSPNGATDEDVLPTAPTPPATEKGDDTAQPVSSAIPRMLRGRWGMVPADCTSVHGDAKGLMEISPTTLTFYESRGTLRTIKETEPSRLRALYDFEGEGMQWKRDMLLTVQDDGQTLIRQEFGEGAAPEAYRYKRCAD